MNRVKPFHQDARSHTRLVGMKVRDEFICPITLELFRDPVIASDGNTYERCALDKWLKTNNTSPKTRQPMNSMYLANSNLKKLIKDIIVEGGVQLYSHDRTSSRIFSIVPQTILTLTCIGPSESEWNLVTQEISHAGVIGGRKLQHSIQLSNPIDVMVFSDSTISRRHFEVVYSKRLSKYTIQDLGSAGGTYLRLQHNEKHILSEGITILVGKHQFRVISTVGCSNISTTCKRSIILGKYNSTTYPSTLHNFHTPSFEDFLVTSNKRLLDTIIFPSESNHKDHQLPPSLAPIQQTRPNSTNRCISSNNRRQSLILSRVPSINSEAVTSSIYNSNDADYSPRSPSTVNTAQPQTQSTTQCLRRSLRINTNFQRTSALGHTDSNSNSGPAHQQLFDPSKCPKTPHKSIKKPVPTNNLNKYRYHSLPLSYDIQINQVLVSIADNRAYLKEQRKVNKICHNKFSTAQTSDAIIIQKDNELDDTRLSTKSSDSVQSVATLTFKSSSVKPSITLTCVYPEGSPLHGRSYIIGPEGAVIGRKPSNKIALCTDSHATIDQSVSAEHAQVSYDPGKRVFMISDGIASKSSTNGTWRRLSASGTSSDPEPLEPGMELLVGNLRFKVGTSVTIIEEDID